MTQEEIKKERLSLKKSLTDLTIALIAFEKKMDFLMKESWSVERDKKLAKLMNEHTIALHSALHFGLNYSFQKIRAL